MNNSPRLGFLLTTVFLCGLTSSWAAPRVSKNSSTSTKTGDLGNGIYVLGDDGGSAALPASAPKKVVEAKKVALPPKSKATADVSRSLVRFCRSYLGYKMGNGQCSELAMIGLPAVGGECDLSRQWGRSVCNYSASGGRQYIQMGEAGKVLSKPRRVDMKPGDLIQYENVKFEKRWNGGYSVRSYPHHTSVIESVSRDGRSVRVLEQNVNNTQFVVETTLYLPDLTEGVMHITRPVPRTR